MELRRGERRIINRVPISDYRSMLSIVNDNRAMLAQLCERFHVRRLELFGSATDGSFDPERSDLDFLVEFFSVSPAEHYESYFGMLEAMEELFHRRVDLVETSAMRNPYFIRRVNESRTLLYAA